MSNNSANLIETYTFISSKEVITTGGMIVQNKIRQFLWEKTKQIFYRYVYILEITLIYILQTLRCIIRETNSKHNVKMLKNIPKQTQSI